MYCLHAYHNVQRAQINCQTHLECCRELGVGLTVEVNRGSLQLLAILTDQLRLVVAHVHNELFGGRHYDVVVVRGLGDEPRTSEPSDLVQKCNILITQGSIDL